MTIQLLTLVVVLANVLGAVMALPQAHKLLRNRSVEGVSVTWAAASAAVNACWAVYAVGVGDLGILPVSIISVGSYTAIGLGIVHFSPTPATRLLLPATAAAVVVTTIPLLALLVGGWLAAGLALGALYGVQLLPAVVAVYRAVDVSGVSAATWVLAFVEAALWGVYGYTIRDAGLLTLAGTGLGMSSLVMARLVVQRPSRLRVALASTATDFATV